MPDLKRYVGLSNGFRNVNKSHEILKPTMKTENEPEQLSDAGKQLGVTI